MRTFDVIIWGASGFTGRLVAEYLLKQYGYPLKHVILNREIPKIHLDGLKYWKENKSDLNEIAPHLETLDKKLEDQNQNAAKIQNAVNKIFNDQLILIPIEEQQQIVHDLPTLIKFAKHFTS